MVKSQKPHAHRKKISQRRLKIYQRRYETSHRGPTNDSAKWAAYSSYSIINNEGQAITLESLNKTCDVLVSQNDVANFNAAMHRLRNWRVEMHGTWR